MVVSLGADCPKPNAGLGASGLAVSEEPNDTSEAGAPNGEALVVVVDLATEDPPKPNEDPVDEADCPKGVAGVVDALDAEPKVKEGVVADLGASAAGVAGLPNENPPNGLAFAAGATAGAGVGAAGVVEAPNVNPADGGWVDGVVDDD